MKDGGDRRRGAGFYRALVEETEAMLAVLDPGGAIRYANRPAAAALGVEAETLAGTPFVELLHDEDRARVEALFDHQLRDAGERAAFRVRLRRSDGETRAVEAVARSTADGVLVTAWPAAERRAEGPMARRAHDHLSAYVTVGIDGVIHACNPAFVKLFGFASETEAADTDFWSLFPRSNVRQKLGELLPALGRVENFETEALRRDGEVVYLLINVVGELDAAGELALLKAQVLDISERRKLEQQGGRAQRMEALGRLACAVAHDFNNLLTAILGYVDMLEGSLEPETAALRQVREVRKAGLQAAALTRQLLTFGKGKAVEIKVVEINEVIHEMHRMLTQLLGGEIELVLDLDTDLDPVMIDRSQIEQVVLNLALNARDAMDGAGRLTLRTVNHRVERPFVLHHDSVEPGDYAMLAVRDTGCGIDPAIMDHLFEPFFTTKEPGQGTGLGLSTVYGIVKQNSGFISVYNEPEGGVTFKVSFPSVKQEAAVAETAAPADETRVREPLTILFAEDDAAVRKLVAGVLESRGHRVLAAGDGREALTLAERHDGGVDLLVTDISMPRVDGLALARALLAEHPAVPVLFISGTAREDSVALDADAPTGFLEKPFTPSQLLHKIRALV